MKYILAGYIAVLKTIRVLLVGKKKKMKVDIEQATSRFGLNLHTKNPPTMQETPVRFLGQEDPLEKG